jgi:hypothetical protein
MIENQFLFSKIIPILILAYVLTERIHQHGSLFLRRLGEKELVFMNLSALLNCLRQYQAEADGMDQQALPVG